MANQQSDPPAAAAGAAKRSTDIEPSRGSVKRAKLQTDKRASALARSKEFLQSLKLDEDDDSALGQIANDVWCLENVATVFDWRETNAVLTKEVKDFWAYCMGAAKQHHICARGSPGVGKSLTFVYLIRMHLREEKRVIYLYRTKDKKGFYFVWKVGSETEVYPESEIIEEVVGNWGTELDDTYYLCDAAKTHDSSDPDIGDLAMNVIINACADTKHWCGLMTKKQIFVAFDKFEGSDELDESFLEERHRKVAIPRYLFGPEVDVDAITKQQDKDLALLSSEKVQQVLDNISELNGDDSSAPRYTIMCTTGRAPDSSFVSDLVQEKVATRHMKNLWNEIGAEETSSTCGHLFESYDSSLLARESILVACWSAVAMSKKLYKEIFPLDLGGCSGGIRRARSIIQGCKSGPDNVIFYSFNESEPFVDFLYKRENEYYAIQVTIGKHHPCDEEELVRFLDELDLQKGQEFNLVYAVPSSTFGNFTTSPVEPQLINEFPASCYIVHAEIARPN